VRAVASPTDSLVVSASRDGTVRSWSLPKKPAINPLFSNAAASVGQGQVDVSIFDQHSGYVNSVAFHPEGMNHARFELNTRIRCQRWTG
jgi:WD40 repeat protein